MNSPRLLLIDDDNLSRKMYLNILKEEEYQIDTADNPERALSLISSNNFDLIITDLLNNKENRDDLWFVRQIKARNPTQEIIILTSHATTNSAIGALKAGVSDYLRKPVNPEEFRITTKRILEKSRLFRENDRLQETINLLETCNRISSCLDLDDLSQMILDTMLHLFNSGVGVHCKFDRKKEKFSAKYTRNIGGALENQVSEYLNASLAKKPGSMEEILMVHPLSDFPTAKGGSNPFRSMLYVPILPKGQLESACAIFHLKNEETPTRQKLQNINVITKQINLAFENAIKLRNAKELAYIDELTGCYNTRYLDDFINKEIHRAKRHGYALSFLFLDLDFFKKVNDTHGHLVGSQVLIDVAKIIRQCSREIDIVIRYGGDEYVILLINTSARGARDVAERIRQSIQNFSFGKSDGLKLKLTASIGIASYPEHAKDKRDVLDLADKAMYHVKSTTRNSVYIAQSEIKDRPLKPH